MKRKCIEIEIENEKWNENALRSRSEISKKSRETGLSQVTVPRLKINPKYSHSVQHFHSFLAFLPLYIFCMKCNYCDCNQPIFTRKAEKALPLAFWQRPEFYFGARSKMLFCAKCFASYLSDIFSKLQIAALYSMQHLIFEGILSEKECQIFGRRLGGRIQGFNQSQSQIWFCIVKFWWLGQIQVQVVEWNLILVERVNDGVMIFFHL